MEKFKSKNKNSNLGIRKKIDNSKEKINDSIIGKILSKLKWLDPFTYVDLFVIPKVKKVTDSEIVETIINIIFAGIFALIVYILLGMIFGTSSPLVIVFSASMEPNVVRGDVIGITKINENTYLGEEIDINRNIKNVPVSNYLSSDYYNGKLLQININNEKIIPNAEGSIVVYNSYPQNLPIIHRSIAKINANDGTFILTKGDNDLTNPTFDQDCGKIDILRNSSTKPCVTFYAIPLKEIEGVAFFNIPKIGCVKLWLFDDLLSILTTGKLPRDFRGIC